MRTSKLLVSTNGDTTQRFTNTLRANGTALSSGVSYRISAPAGYTGPIILDSATGAVSFGRAIYDKVTRSRTPERVTIEATYQGETASYSFTVTDHFSPQASPDRTYTPTHRPRKTCLGPKPLPASDGGGKVVPFALASPGDTHADFSTSFSPCRSKASRFQYSSFVKSQSPCLFILSHSVRLRI